MPTVFFRMFSARALCHRLVATIRAALVILIILFSAHAYALRCGTQLVSDNAHITEVIEKCGEPIYESRKTEYVTTYISDDSGLGNTVTEPGVRVGREVTREIQVTELIYDFGLERLKRKLRFVDGHLDKVTRLTRGRPR